MRDDRWVWAFSGILADKNTSGGKESYTDCCITRRSSFRSKCSVWVVPEAKSVIKNSRFGRPKTLFLLAGFCSLPTCSLGLLPFHKKCCYICTPITTTLCFILLHLHSNNNYFFFTFFVLILILTRSSGTDCTQWFVDSFLIEGLRVLDPVQIIKLRQTCSFGLYKTWLAHIKHKSKAYFMWRNSDILKSYMLCTSYSNGRNSIPTYT